MEDQQRLKVEQVAEIYFTILSDNVGDYNRTFAIEEHSETCDLITLMFIVSDSGDVSYYGYD
jgi:hypothetical protein